MPIKRLIKLPSLIQESVQSYI